MGGNQSYIAQPILNIELIGHDKYGEVQKLANVKHLKIEVMDNGFVRVGDSGVEVMGPRSRSDILACIYRLKDAIEVATSLKYTVI